MRIVINHCFEKSAVGDRRFTHVNHLLAALVNDLNMCESTITHSRFFKTVIYYLNHCFGESGVVDRGSEHTKIFRERSD